MSRTVLWLDNDPPQIEPYVVALRRDGIDVRVERTVSGAERALEDEPGLVIVDVMVPTKSSEEERLYSPDETDAGFKTGLVFFRRNGERIRSYGGKILVMTVRLDEEIYNQFISAGLKADEFATKFSLREVPSFLRRVLPLLG